MFRPPYQLYINNLSFVSVIFDVHWLLEGTALIESPVSLGNSTFIKFMWNGFEGLISLNASQACCVLL